MRFQADFIAYGLSNADAFNALNASISVGRSERLWQRDSLSARKVLVAGGFGPSHGITQTSAKLYNPQGGTWLLTGMSTACDAHTATLLHD